MCSKVYNVHVHARVYDVRGYALLCNRNVNLMNWYRSLTRKTLRIHLHTSGWAVKAKACSQSFSKISKWISLWNVIFDYLPNRSILVCDIQIICHANALPLWCHLNIEQHSMFRTYARVLIKWNMTNQTLGV